MSLQLDALRECTSKFDVHETLEEFPASIEDFYIQTWIRIMNQPQKKAMLAKSALLWVLTATRSLTLSELRYAVATTPNDLRFDPNRVVPGYTLLSLCRGLLTLELPGVANFVRLVRTCSSFFLH